MRLDKITIRLISQSDKINLNTSPTMDVDWCLHGEPLTLSLPLPKVLELRQTKNMGLDLIQSPYAPRPSSLSHNMRRPLGKSPALVISQYSMSSHTHLRHLEIQSHLR